MSSSWDLPPSSTGSRLGVDVKNVSSFVAQTTQSSAAPQSPQRSSPSQPKKDDHGHRKRNRIVLSCVQCRRRKLKCDRQFPCGACSRRGAADECYYQRHEKSRFDDSGFLERRMETLEKLVRGLVGEAALQQIKDGSYESVSKGEAGTSSGDETIALQQSIAIGESGPESLDNLNLAMGQLTILPESEGGTLYAGGTAWDAVFAQFAELKQLLKQFRDQGSGMLEYPPQLGHMPELSSNISWAPSESFHSRADDEIVGVPELASCFPFDNCFPPTMAEVLALLPSAQLMANLINKFFKSLLPFSRIVHFHTFMREFEEFEKAPGDAKPAWVALLFSMLSSALMLHSPAAFATFNDTDLTHEQTGRKFNKGAKAALIHAQFLRSHQLPVIQTLVLLQLSIHPDDMAVSSWALHGASKNLALQMGLHREPSLFKIPEPEAEIRRRVWWILYIQDRLSCINHGISVSWLDSDADTREPLIVNDDQLTPDLAEKRHTYPSGTDAPFCTMTILYCQLNLAKILTHVIQIAFGLKRTNYSEILKLDEEVENFRRNISPKILQPESPMYDKRLEPVAIILKSFYLKSILLLHRPFIGRSKENAQFKWSRERAVQAALEIVQISIQLFTSHNILLDNHFAAYPMLAHGLFPAPVALALDLYTYPDQPNPEPLRTALLDLRHVYLQLCTKFAPLKRLYKIINVLMGKAWEKAELTLPPEEKPSRMSSISSQSTPSPVTGNDNGLKWGPQGVVPTSMQQFLPTNAYNTGVDWPSPQNLTHHNAQENILRVPVDQVSWNGSSVNPFPLFGSDTSSEYGVIPQPPESLDIENNIPWNQTEWDLFVNAMDLDPVVNGTSFV